MRQDHVMEGLIVVELCESECFGVDKPHFDVLLYSRELGSRVDGTQEGAGPTKD